MPFRSLSGQTLVVRRSDELAAYELHGGRARWSVDLSPSGSAPLESEALADRAFSGGPQWAPFHRRRAGLHASSKTPPPYVRPDLHAPRPANAASNCRRRTACRAYDLHERKAGVAACRNRAAGPSPAARTRRSRRRFSRAAAGLRRHACTYWDGPTREPTCSALDPADGTVRWGRSLAGFSGFETDGCVAVRAGVRSAGTGRIADLPDARRDGDRRRPGDAHLPLGLPRPADRGAVAVAAPLGTAVPGGRSALVERLAGKPGSSGRSPLLLRFASIGRDSRPGHRFGQSSLDAAGRQRVVPRTDRRRTAAGRLAIPGAGLRRGDRRAAVEFGDRPSQRPRLRSPRDVTCCPSRPAAWRPSTCRPEPSISRSPGETAPLGNLVPLARRCRRGRRLAVARSTGRFSRRSTDCGPRPRKDCGIIQLTAMRCDELAQLGPRGGRLRERRATLSEAARFRRARRKARDAAARGRTGREEDACHRREPKRPRRAEKSRDGAIAAGRRQPRDALGDGPAGIVRNAAWPTSSGTQSDCFARAPNCYARRRATTQRAVALRTVETALAGQGERLLGLKAFLELARLELPAQIEVERGPRRVVAFDRQLGADLQDLLQGCSPAERRQADLRIEAGSEAGDRPGRRGCCSAGSSSDCATSVWTGLCAQNGSGPAAGPGLLSNPTGAVGGDDEQRRAPRGRGVARPCRALPLRMATVGRRPFVTVAWPPISATCDSTTVCGRPI